MEDNDFRYFTMTRGNNIKQSSVSRKKKHEHVLANNLTTSVLDPKGYM